MSALSSNVVKPLNSSDMVEIYVSLGSNINQHHYIRAAVKALRHQYGSIALSPVYESIAMGFAGDNFYNLVGQFNTTQTITEVTQQLTLIEDANDRERNGPRFGPRTLDIDLLLYGDLIINNDQLQLPRKEITKYAFVLRPLADIAPQRIDPVLKKTYQELWEKLDTTHQRLWQIPFDFDPP